MTYRSSPTLKWQPPKWSFLSCHWSSWDVLEQIFRMSRCSCLAALVELGTWKGGWKWKRRGGWKEDQAKTKVHGQGSKFNFQLCIYIGKTHRPILCFSWIELQSKLSRQSTPQSSGMEGRKLQMKWNQAQCQPGYKTIRDLFSLLKVRGRAHNFQRGPNTNTLQTLPQNRNRRNTTRFSLWGHNYAYT